LRYQLERSEFPEIGRFPLRPNSAAVEGTVVHECLEALVKAFSMAGLPQLGSDAARECARSVGLTDLIGVKLDEARREFVNHPMGAGWKPSTPVYQLANRVIRLFRQQYPAIDHVSHGYRKGSSSDGEAEPVPASQLAGRLISSGALTEVKLCHPKLPFQGIIDLVLRRDGGTVIVDYKAGAKDPAHRLQALRYTLLWWRTTGVLPTWLEVQYLADRYSEQVSESLLIAIESELEEEISAAVSLLATPPARARVDAHCRTCGVRQFCDGYWSGQSASFRERGEFSDIELTVNGLPSADGFDGIGIGGESVKVTAVPEIGKMWFLGVEKGQRIRLVGIVAGKKTGEIRVLSTSEVWRISR
jgi:RecB family exonuclease